MQLFTLFTYVNILNEKLFTVFRTWHNYTMFTYRDTQEMGSIKTPFFINAYNLIFICFTSMK